MQAGVCLSKVIAIKGTFYLLLPAPLRDRMTWREGDSIAIREAGDKLILERIPLEKYSILRTGGVGV